MSHDENDFVRSSKAGDGATLSCTKREVDRLKPIHYLHIREHKLMRGLLVENEGVGETTVRVRPLGREDARRLIQSPHRRQAAFLNIGEKDLVRQCRVGLADVRRGVEGVLSQQAAVPSPRTGDEVQDDIGGTGSESPLAASGAGCVDFARVGGGQMSKDSTVCQRDSSTTRRRRRGSIGLSSSQNTRRLAPKGRQRPKVTTHSLGVRFLPDRKIGALGAGRGDENGGQEGEEREKGASLLHR